MGSPIGKPVRFKPSGAADKPRSPSVRGTTEPKEETKVESTDAESSESSTESAPSGPSLADVIKTIATTPEYAAAAARLFEAKDPAYLAALASGNPATLLAVVAAEAAKAEKKQDSSPPSEDLPTTKDRPGEVAEGEEEEEEEGEDEPSFYETYKTPIWVIGGVLGLYFAGQFAKKKGWI